MMFWLDLSRQECAHVTSQDSYIFSSRRFPLYFKIRMVGILVSLGLYALFCPFYDIFIDHADSQPYIGIGVGFFTATFVGATFMNTLYLKVFHMIDDRSLLGQFLTMRCSLQIKMTALENPSIVSPPLYLGECLFP